MNFKDQSSDDILIVVPFISDSEYAAFGNVLLWIAVFLSNFIDAVASEVAFILLSLLTGAFSVFGCVLFIPLLKKWVNKYPLLSITVADAAMLLFYFLLDTATSPVFITMSACVVLLGCVVLFFVFKYLRHSKLIEQAL